ncbi:unnamed protein product [Candidula unifasciata]|uniref:PiggyBac transposable element-derived protein domain-containing protein n=1 Tax=Candidula unifasciata TaxID=100452 RepID=A0A8S3Z0P7_9EUPU|nr:unnamed protein product [Candidula unifasciata]
MSDQSSSSRPAKRFTALEASNLIKHWIDQSDVELDNESSDVEFPQPVDESSSDEERVRSLPPAKRKTLTNSAMATQENSDAEAPRNVTLASPNVSASSTSTTSSTRQNDSRGQWRGITEGRTRSRFLFKPPCPAGVTEHLDVSTTLKSFNVLFDGDIKEYLLNQINDFAKMKCQQNTPASKHSIYGRWKDVTSLELDKFFAVLINMGIHKKPSIRHFWCQAPDMHTPWFGHMFSRNRFQDIYHTMLHAAGDEAEGKDKIEPFINLVLEKCRAAFYPYENLSLDEMVIGFKGRWQYKQFNAQKPKKYHIKTFGLCDAATGYVVNLLVYFGRDTSYNPELDADSGHAARATTFFADRYYTTRVLLDHLLQQETYFTGTLNLNRKDFPPQLRVHTVNHLEMKWYMHETDRILCVAFKDKKAKKEVIVVSTHAEVATVPTKKGIIKPAVIDSYNQSMNGCDLLDQKVGYYGIHCRKSIKWWKKIFLWMFEIVQVNSYIIYLLSSGKKNGLHDFKRQLLNQLTEASAQELVSTKYTLQPEASHWQFTDNRHLITYRKQDLRWAFCSPPSKPKRTHFYCSGCPNNPHLHPQCFAPYHLKP